MTLRVMEFGTMTVLLSWVLFKVSVIHSECRKSVLYAECHMLSVICCMCYAECHYAECHYAKSHYAECHYAECHYAECHYAECHYAECQMLSVICCMCYAECHLLHVLCWVSFAACVMLSVIMLNVICCMSLCWVSLCWVSLCWVSLCWVSLCWVSLCWASCRLISGHWTAFYESCIDLTKFTAANLSFYMRKYDFYSFYGHWASKANNYNH